MEVLHRELYSTVSDEDFNEVKKRITPVLDMYYPSELICNANMLELLRQALKVRAEPLHKKKGPKKGTVNYYHIWLKEDGKYDSWKADNPGKSYQDYQHYMKPAWAALQSNKTKIETLRSQAQVQTS